ncbi:MULTISPECIES: hypothetical protein [Planotetraspora]|uniref:Uncharacterized protein n=2 Tax=Planotetraspora TaxID=58120 RepID=A0A8J3UGN7_9ACTN|nr:MULTISPECIES: hypothetical protein [Planotetraspora]GII29802.1 hypothetical protein Pmi06nite_32440 [Planotetraspora mira]GII45264.1 hypothetical protein Psi02_16880 [Planotetraspora silvatica]
MNVTPDYTNVGPGILAFMVVAAIGVALFFLIKSMNRKFAKINGPDDRLENRQDGGDE